MPRRATKPDADGPRRGPVITPTALTGVAHLIFGEGRTAGPTVAASVGVSHNLLWSYLNRRQMPVAVALRLADDLSARAARLLQAAQTLRALATAAQRAA